MILHQKVIFYNYDHTAGSKTFSKIKKLLLSKILWFPKIREILFRSKFTTEVHVNKSLKKSLKYANKIQANYAIIIGEEEDKNELYTIKNLHTGNQSSIKKDFVLEFFVCVMLLFFSYK